MKIIANIWKHPKTTAAGLLIAMASVAGVLSQQGVTLGKVGTGTAVSLVSALATALLGLLAKDPETGTEGTGEQGSQQAKLGAWMLIALHDSAAVDAGMHGHGRGAGHCELDAGLAERGGHCGFDGVAAGAGGCADFYRGHGGVRRGQQSAGGAGKGVPGQSLGGRAGGAAKPNRHIPATSEHGAVAGSQEL